MRMLPRPELLVSSEPPFQTGEVSGSNQARIIWMPPKVPTLPMPSKEFVSCSSTKCQRRNWATVSQTRSAVESRGEDPRRNGDISFCLSAGDGRRALSEEVRNALFEVFGLEACQHFTLGDFRGFCERLEHPLIHLALDHPQRSRADIRREVARISAHLVEKAFLGEHLVHKPHAERLSRVNLPRGK